MRNPTTVLIADDNYLMRGSLKMIIGGIENVVLVGEATNGEEALEMVKSLSPDIILMDINMTPVNGFEASRKILKINPATKIIALSLHNKASYAKNMFQLGAFGYVSKSSPHNDLIEAITKVMKGEKYLDKGLEGQVDI